MKAKKQKAIGFLKNAEDHAKKAEANIAHARGLIAIESIRYKDLAGGSKKLIQGLKSLQANLKAEIKRRD